MGKEFHIISNSLRDPGYVFAREVREFLQGQGQSCEIIVHPHREQLRQRLDAERDLVIVLGGDGTVMRAANDVLGTQVPILGINYGHLGYLTEADRSNWRAALLQLIDGRYELEPRMMLCGRIIQHSSTDGSEIQGPVGYALNDVVIARSLGLTTVDFSIYVDGQLFNAFTADGVIISTPTGSTAYNLSVGGPVVEPLARVIVVTPLASHSLGNRSVVLSPEDQITIEMGTPRYNKKLFAQCSFDGEGSVNLEPGDRIEVARAPVVTRLVKLRKQSFMKKLHEKLR